MVGKLGTSFCLVGPRGALRRKLGHACCTAQGGHLRNDAAERRGYPLGKLGGQRKGNPNTQPATITRSTLRAPGPSCRQ